MDYIDENGDLIRVTTIVPGWLVRWIRSPTFKRRKPPVPFSKNGTKNTMKPANLICEIKFGSHLYGTNTEQSDHDFKGVFLPSKEEILLGRIPRSYHPNQDDSRKNEPGELDCEYTSLHHFLHLAMQGQTMAIDMLFAPDSMVFLNPKYGLSPWPRAHRIWFAKHKSYHVGIGTKSKIRYWYRYVRRTCKTNPRFEAP